MEIKQTDIKTGMYYVSNIVFPLDVDLGVSIKSESHVLILRIAQVGGKMERPACCALFTVTESSPKSNG